MKQPIRFGIGYDVHCLVENRKMILGGVDIPFDRGLLGHSDADCLVHAVMDAMLGALALGDIGKFFPDDDDAYLGADSMKLLKIVAEKVANEGYAVGNIDSVIIAQVPKCAPYIDDMRQNIADTLGIDVSQVGVKATTEERLGFTGREEGIAAQAVACLVLK